MQKSRGDKHGIGYDLNASTSRNVVALKKLINFVPASYDSHVGLSRLERNDKGKGKNTKMLSSFLGIRGFSRQSSHVPMRRIPFQRKVLTCHFCGKRDHIQLYYNQLSHKYPIRKNSYEYEIETHNYFLMKSFLL